MSHLLRLCLFASLLATVTACSDSVDPFVGDSPDTGSTRDVGGGDTSGDTG